MKISSRQFFSCVFCALTLLPAALWAAEFKSIGNQPAILFDAPSQKALKLFIAPNGMPVEIILSYGQWTKVRDAEGGLAWLENRQLSNQRNVIVQAEQARIYRRPEDSAEVVFTAERKVILELFDATQEGHESTHPGWVKVKHRDGLTGYIKLLDIWGI